MSQSIKSNGDPEPRPSCRGNGSDWTTALKMFVGILGGLAVQLVGLWVVGNVAPPGQTYRWLVLLAGTTLFVWGCSLLAKSKGYNQAWGLLGLTSCFGLIVLALFPRVKQGDPKSPEYSLGILQRNAVLGISLGMVAVILACLAVVAETWKRGFHHVEYDLVVW